MILTYFILFLSFLDEYINKFAYKYTIISYYDISSLYCQKIIFIINKNYVCIK